MAKRRPRRWPSPALIPRWGVGLHLTLLCGESALGPAQIPGLVDEWRRFSEDPFAAGCRYFFRKSLRQQLRREMAAQFERFHATGLPLDHVNGHLNIHLHPVVFDLLMEEAEQWGIRRLRLTRDRFWLNARLAGGAWGLPREPRGHSSARCPSVLGGPSSRARDPVRAHGVRFAPERTGVNEAYVLGLLPRLPAGVCETLFASFRLAGFRGVEGLPEPRRAEPAPRTRHPADSLSGSGPMAKFLVILLIALVLEAIGVVCISRGLKQIGGNGAGFGFGGPSSSAGRADQSQPAHRGCSSKRCSSSVCSC